VTGKHFAEPLESPENRLWLSPISIWEVLILYRKRRILPNEDIQVWLRNALESIPLREAPVNFEVAREVGRTRLAHRDPADYFLVATARVFELTLVTADEQLQRVPGLQVLSNR
jgi:PIN domain nuclease of toxin-antitoxin system